MFCPVAGLSQSVAGFVLPIQGYGEASFLAQEEKHVRGSLTPSFQRQRGKGE